MKLRALKPFRYATRAIAPGDEFTARRGDARVLVGIGKAERILENKAPEPSEEPIDILRAQAVALGVKVDGRWAEDRLRAEIEKAQE
jgi:hypothetical protein